MFTKTKGEIYRVLFLLSFLWTNTFISVSVITMFHLEPPPRSIEEIVSINNKICMSDFFHTMAMVTLLPWRYWFQASMFFYLVPCEGLLPSATKRNYIDELSTMYYCVEDEFPPAPLSVLILCIDSINPGIQSPSPHSRCPGILIF